MKQVAVIAVILENPSSCVGFNETVGRFKSILKGRVGIPFDEKNLATVTLIVEGKAPEIDEFATQLTKLSGATVGVTKQQA